MKTFSSTIACLALLLASAVPAHAVSIPNEAEWADGTNWTFRQNFLGFPEVWMYVPDTFSPRAGERRGLVFHLIGCGQRPFQAAQAAGWPEAAEAFGMVVVVPGPVNPARPNRDAANVECFNYGYDGAFGVYIPRPNDPDQAAVIGAARALSSEPAFADLAIDPNQMYVAGLSAGGALAVEVACMAPDVFAGTATAAAPGIATAQGTAVMPPPFGYGPDTVVRQCQQWADQAGARDMLGSQVHAIVSDDNGLPAGSGPLDTSKFNNQRIWDGDKFCPHIYQENRALALARMMGLGDAPSARGVEIGRGEGIGCPGGERSAGDAGEVQCLINDFEVREWAALADVWTDAEGNSRIVRIEQDTLRHAWPSGPEGLADLPGGATPTRADLRDDGLIDPATGEFVRARMNLAANGQYGVIYFNHDAVDFPMYVAGLWNHNNPRLPRHQAPSIDDLELDVRQDATGTYGVEVSGRVVASGEAIVTALRIELSDAAGSVVDVIEPALDGVGDQPFAVRFWPLVDGRYRVSITVEDDLETAGSTDRVVAVGDVPGEPPVVTLDGVASSGPGCLTFSGTASDPDGRVAAVQVEILGLGRLPAQLSGDAWSAERCDLEPGRYTVFASAVDTDGDHSLPSPLRRVVLRGGEAEAISGDLTAHANAGRVARFTPEYFDYRDRYCEMVFFVWQCEAFELSRCSADEPWTDGPSECGGEAGRAELVLEIDAPVVAAVGDEVAFTVTVRNAGPDDATAVHVIDPLPAALRFERVDPRCALTGTTVICHVGDLAVGAEETLEIVTTAAGGGGIANVARVGSAQSDGEVSARFEVQIAGQGTGEDGTDPWADEGIEGGEIGPGDPPDGEGPDAELPAAGCNTRPGPSSPLAGLALLALLAIRRRRA